MDASTQTRNFESHKLYSYGFRKICIRDRWGHFLTRKRALFLPHWANCCKPAGYRVTIQKFDPYINIDPGTMNPYEHGECYVTDDGAETDLDLGHYERFLNVRTSQDNNVTTGRIYNTVITKERRGEFLGKTVQVIPHITDEIKANIFKLGRNGQLRHRDYRNRRLRWGYRIIALHRGRSAGAVGPGAG